MISIADYLGKEKAVEVVEVGITIAKKAIEGTADSVTVFEELKAIPEEQRLEVSLIFCSYFLSNANSLIDPNALNFTNVVSQIAIADRLGFLDELKLDEENKK